jgi:hypothetical protein
LRRVLRSSIDSDLEFPIRCFIVDLRCSPLSRAASEGNKELEAGFEVLGNEGVDGAIAVICEFREERETRDGEGKKKKKRCNNIKK